MKKYILSLIAVLLIFSSCEKEKKVSIPSNEEEKKTKTSPSFVEKAEGLSPDFSLKEDKKKVVRNNKKLKENIDKKKPFMNSKPKEKPEIEEKDKPYVPKREVIKVKKEEVDIKAKTFKKPRYMVQKEYENVDFFDVYSDTKIPHERTKNLKKVSEIILDNDGIYFLLMPNITEGKFTVQKVTYDPDEKEYSLDKEVYSKVLEEKETVLLKMDTSLENEYYLIRYEDSNSYFVETILKQASDGKIGSLDKGFNLEK